MPKRNYYKTLILKCFLASLLLLFLTQISAFASFSSPKNPDLIARDDSKVAYISSQIIVKLKDGIRITDLSGLRSAQLNSSSQLPFGYELVHISGDVESACTELMQNEYVISAEPNYERNAQLEPNDPLWVQEKNLLVSNAVDGWNINTGSAEVIVAVIDTGVDYTHPDLAPNLLPGVNFREVGEDYLDDSGHGTAVSGVIGAVGNNSTGVAGAAWNVRILPIRTCGGETLTCSVADEVKGIAEAIKRNADIINLSLGGFQKSSAEEDAVQSAWNAGILVFAAVGNQGLLGKFDDPDLSQNIAYPAGYDCVIGVSSIDYPTGGDLNKVQLSSFSNYGDSVSVTAVGSNIQTTAPSYDVAYNIFLRDKLNYGRISGTSFSTPLVCGLAALIKSQFPEMTNAQIRTRIENSAMDIGEPGRDDKYGFGLVDFYSALIGGTHSENSAFVLGITASPILTDDVAVIVKCKYPTSNLPLVYFSYVTDGYSPLNQLTLIPLGYMPYMWIGRLHTTNKGAIRFLISGQSEDSWMPVLEMEYYKN
jgi:serine protease